MTITVLDNTTASSLYYILPPVLGWIGALVSAAKGIGSLYSKYGKYAGTIGKVAGAMGGAAKGSQEGRQREDAINAQIYDAAMSGAANQGKIDLDRLKFELDAGGQRMSNIGRASLLNNVQDFSMGGPAGDDVKGSARANSWKGSGGLRPSALGPEVKEAANLLIARELAKLKGGEKFADIKFPETPQLSKAGWLEKIMGGAGMAGGILGSIGDAAGKKTVPINADVAKDMGITDPSVWSNIKFGG